MIDLVNTHIKKGGYSHDDVKKALNVGDLSIILKDIPYFYDVLSQNIRFDV
jgi:hypothetical protein